MAALANIRHVERERLRGLLLPGHLVQVSGPPMIGKLTVVNQVLQDMDRESRLQNSYSPIPHAGPFIFHQFCCKHSGNRKSVLVNMAAKLSNDPSQNLNPEFVSAEYVLYNLRSVMQSVDELHQMRCHHIIVFEKCESLVTQDADSWFLQFLSKLMKEMRPHLVTIIFTSYKRFEWSGVYSDMPDRMVMGPIQDSDGNVCFTLEMGQLVDSDILCLLHHFAPMVDPSPYLQTFQKFFGFPEAVRKVAQTFLRAAIRQGDRSSFSPESLETLIKTDMNFLHSVFGCRLDEVIDWVGFQNLLILRHIGSSLDSSATRECFQSVATGECDYDRWRVLSYQLERFYVIRELPGVQRIVVHPLVVYFCSTQFRTMLVTLRGQETNLFSNRFTHFLCATLTSLDALSSLKGMQLTVVTNLLHECPNIRHVIGMALLANEDSYGAYLKLALSGGGILGLLCPREVISFFDCLCQRAQVYGRSPIEQAILQGLYGQALAWGTGSNWQECCDHLSKAIAVLSRPGVEPSYYLLLFLKERAMIQARQGRYDESLRGFKKARELFGRIKTHALGERFAVTESKLRETQLSTCVYETVPMIFKGNNERAQKRLTCLVEVMEQEFPNSIDLATAYNQRGLAIQRGRARADSPERARECYLICYRLRSFFLKVNPIPQYAPLNNVAMLSYRSGDFDDFYKRLDQALQISQQYDWQHYYTGLSLAHLAEGSMGLGHFQSALMYLLEADRILTLTAKDHDLRLRVLLELAHVMVVLSQRPSEQQHSQQQLVHAAHYPTIDGQLVPTAARMCKPISEADLKKTAIFYLERLTALAHDMEGTFSDDGHHTVLSAYEHALTLKWQNPREVELYKTLIFKHVEKNNFEQIFLEEAPTRYHNVFYHRKAYWYLRQCNENGHRLDRRIYLSKICPACTVCTKYGGGYVTEDLWFNVIDARTLKGRAHPDAQILWCSMSHNESGVASALAFKLSNPTLQEEISTELTLSSAQYSSQKEISEALLRPNKTLAMRGAKGKSTVPSLSDLSYDSKTATTAEAREKADLQQRIIFAGLNTKLPGISRTPHQTSDDYLRNTDQSIYHSDPHIQPSQSPPEVPHDTLNEEGAVGYSDRQFHRPDAPSPFPSPYRLTNRATNEMNTSPGFSDLNLQTGLLQSSLMKPDNSRPRSRSNQGREYREPVEDSEPLGAHCLQVMEPEIFRRRQPEEDDEGEASGGTNTDFKPDFDEESYQVLCQKLDLAALSDTSAVWSSLWRDTFSVADDVGDRDISHLQGSGPDNVYSSSIRYASITEGRISDICDENDNLDSGLGQVKASSFEAKTKNIEQGIRKPSALSNNRTQNLQEKPNVTLSLSSGKGSLNNLIQGETHVTSDDRIHGQRETSSSEVENNNTLHGIRELTTSNEYGRQSGQNQSSSGLGLSSGRGSMPDTISDDVHGLPGDCIHIQSGTSICDTENNNTQCAIREFTASNDYERQNGPNQPSSGLDLSIGHGSMQNCISDNLNVLSEEHNHRQRETIIFDTQNINTQREIRELTATNDNTGQNGENQSSSGLS